MKPDRGDGQSDKPLYAGRSDDLMPALREAWAHDMAAWVRTGGRLMWNGDELVFCREGHPEPAYPQAGPPRPKQRAKPALALIELDFSQMERVR